MLYYLMYGLLGSGLALGAYGVLVAAVVDRTNGNS